MIGRFFPIMGHFGALSTVLVVCLLSSLGAEAHSKHLRNGTSPVKTRLALIKLLHSPIAETAEEKTVSVPFAPPILNASEDFICPRLEVCRLSISGDDQNSATCFWFLSGHIGHCRSDDLTLIPLCDATRLFSCLPLPFSDKVALSVFEPSQFMVDVTIILRDNETSSGGYESTQLLTLPESLRLFRSIMFERNEPRRGGGLRPLDGGGFSFERFFLDGLQALRTIAQSVVFVVGKTIGDVQEFLDNAAQELFAHNQHPVGVVVHEPDEEDDVDVMSRPFIQRPYPGRPNGVLSNKKVNHHGNFVHHQHILTKDEAQKYAQDAELVNQLNIALQLMASDEHNADWADAAHMDNLKFHSPETTWRKIHSSKPRVFDSENMKGTRTHFNRILLHRLMFFLSDHDPALRGKLAQAVEGAFGPEADDTKGDGNKLFVAVKEEVVPRSKGKSQAAKQNVKVMRIAPRFIDGLKQMQKIFSVDTDSSDDRTELERTIYEQTSDNNELASAGATTFIEDFQRPKGGKSENNEDASDQAAKVAASSHFWSLIRTKQRLLGNLKLALANMLPWQESLDHDNVTVIEHADVATADIPQESLTHPTEVSFVNFAEGDWCALTPRRNRQLLSVYCFEKRSDYIGPCGDLDPYELMPCTKDDMISSAFIGQDNNRLNITLDTYIFDENVADETKTDADLFVGSSTWPWNPNPSLKESCTCDDTLGLDKNCRQPIPWCWVRPESGCPDALRIEIRYPQGYVSEDHDESFGGKIWSQLACSKYIQKQQTEAEQTFIDEPQYFRFFF